MNKRRFQIRVTDYGIMILETKWKRKSVQIIRSDFLHLEEGIVRDGEIIAGRELLQVLDRFFKDRKYRVSYEISFSLWSSKVITKIIDKREKESRGLDGKLLREKYCLGRDESRYIFEKRPYGAGKYLLMIIPQNLLDGYRDICYELGFLKVHMDMNFNGIDRIVSLGGRINNNPMVEGNFLLAGVQNNNILLVGFIHGEMFFQRNIYIREDSSEINYYKIKSSLINMKWNCTWEEVKGFYFGERLQWLQEILRENLEYEEVESAAGGNSYWDEKSEIGYVLDSVGMGL